MFPVHYTSSVYILPSHMTDSQIWLGVSNLSFEGTWMCLKLTMHMQVFT